MSINEVDKPNHLQLLEEIFLVFEYLIFFWTPEERFYSKLSKAEAGHST